MRRILSPREIDILLGPKKDRESDEESRTVRRKRVLRAKKGAMAAEALDSEPEPVTA